MMRIAVIMIHHSPNAKERLAEVMASNVVPIHKMCSRNRILEICLGTCARWMVVLEYI